jgi:hypothetical protein
MVKIVHFSMAGMCREQNRSECLDYLMVLTVCFRMSGMCHDPVSAWMERVTVKKVSFSMDGMCHDANCQFQHVSYLHLSPIFWTKKSTFSLKLVQVEG